MVHLITSLIIVDVMKNSAILNYLLKDSEHNQVQTKKSC